MIDTATDTYDIYIFSNLRNDVCTQTVSDLDILNIPTGTPAKYQAKDACSPTTPWNIQIQPQT